MIQKYLNFHYAVSLDLFGSRDVDERRQLLHRRAEGPLVGGAPHATTIGSTDDSMMVDTLDDGEIGQTEVAALVGLNTDLRREYIADCQNGVNRWNKILADAGLPQRLRPAAHRVQPAGRRVRRDRGDPRPARSSGRRVAAPQGASGCPTDVDKTHVRSLMRPVHERGKIASWIAPPRQGINGKPFDYDYVHSA